MKKLGFVIGLMLIIGFAVEAVGAEFAFHGDMNNRFLVYTNHTDWLDSRDDSFGVINDKTTAARLVPVPGAKPGDWVDWGGLLGRAPVMDVRDRATVGVVQRAGHMPPPLRALGN